MFELDTIEVVLKRLKEDVHVLKQFLLLWSTQSLSQLGSSMTSFALTLWLYEKTGSALSTATLAICSYAPYVIMSIFAGAFTDKFDKKRLMLICDLLAAISTVIVLILFLTDNLEVWHLYAVNVISGLMNTVQVPASEVSTTLLIPKEQYQKASSLSSLSRSVNSILNPILATMVYSLAGLTTVIYFDLGTFFIAFVTLLFFIKIPPTKVEKKESTFKLAKEGLAFLKECPMIFTMIIFMSGINFFASAFDAILPAYVIPNPNGGSTVLGVVTSFAGIAMILGSFIASIMKPPKNRLRVVYITMLLSMMFENFLICFTRVPWCWCLGQILGWIFVPIMSANYDVIFRNTVPVELQGRVYACRNTFQYFTIPIGLFLGGLLVDDVFEPFMFNHSDNQFLTFLFGSGKGSGAGLTLFVMGVLSIIYCLVMGQKLKKFEFK